MIEIRTATAKQPTKWEIINKTKTVYLCYDTEQMPTLITTNLREAKIYCKYNNCQYSEYPPGCYIDHSIEEFNAKYDYT